MLEVVEAFGELEDEVEANEALAEDHYRVAVHVQGIAKFEHVVLEDVDDLLGELICISLCSLD